MYCSLLKQIAISAGLVGVVSSYTVVNLTNVQWTVTSETGNVTVPGKWPSQVHLDLYAAGAIPDPYYGQNEINLRWIAWQNWTYQSGSIQGLKRYNSTTRDKTWLLFDGLDTFTSIQFCGQYVAATQNQFRQYLFDVSNILKNCSSDPQLAINFGSAPSITSSIAKAPGQETWPSGVEQLYEFPNRQFMRKEQSDFGWDWGPAYAPAGPWQPGYVIQVPFGQTYIQNSWVDIYRQGQRNNALPDQSKAWIMNVTVEYLGTFPEGAKVTLGDLNGGTVLSKPLVNVKTRIKKIQRTGILSGQVAIPAQAVELWWPNGFGAQTLYSLQIDIVNSKKKVLASVDKTVGFRTIVLNQTPVTDEEIASGVTPGSHWHFEINGNRFFAKGSNFVPPDAFWPRVTEDRLRILFESVIAAGQNMLRVWASGAYSPDFMYQMADEMGILLWSEFEFGDALYPVDAEFLENVFFEAEYQVRRVNHHPSLALWAGGNELENLELQLVNGSAPGSYLRYKGEYETLFMTTLFPAVFENSRSISYMPSSTNNGYIQLNFVDPPYFTERYQNVKRGWLYGDTDYYNYNSAQAFNYALYPVGRFSNEFGYHSMPSAQTWSTAIDPSDMTFNSTTILLRNHHFPPGGLNTINLSNSRQGMGEMTTAAQQWFPIPHTTSPGANFSSWCLTTQLFQAQYYASQIAFYRRGAGLGQRTLGSLYWQLNDIWQAPSWASIESGGRWKALHYLAASVYQPLIVWPFLNTTTSELQVWVASDLWESAQGVVTATWTDWNGVPLNFTRGALAPSSNFSVGALSSALVTSSANLTAALASANATSKTAVLHLQLSGSKSSDPASDLTHEAWFTVPGALRTANLPDPQLGVRYDAARDVFVVTAPNAVAAFVWLDYDEPGYVMGPSGEMEGGAVVAFEDNAFWLPMGGEKDVGYTVLWDATGGGWMDSVSVWSLWNNTQP